LSNLFGVQHFGGALIMEITSHTSIRSHLIARNSDSWIMLGYVAFAIVALAAIYFASAGPGVTEANLAMATALP
jgi:hypothetical protein